MFFINLNPLDWELNLKTQTIQRPGRADSPGTQRESGRRKRHSVTVSHQVYHAAQGRDRSLVPSCQFPPSWQGWRTGDPPHSPWPIPHYAFIAHTTMPCGRFVSRPQGLLGQWPRSSLPRLMDAVSIFADIHLPQDQL